MGSKQRRQRRVPLRTCIVCGEKTDKRRLIRLVYSSEEGVVIDPTGKRWGRGAYMCSRPSCWERMAASEVLDRALRATVGQDEKRALAERYLAQADSAT